MKKIAVYPGTFDPITNGHIDLVHRGLRIFDKIVVAISTGYNKKTLFNLQERLSLVKEIFSENENVEVVAFDGLLVDFVKKHNANVILRGLRAVSDFEYEYQMASINYKLDSQIQTLFLTPDDKFACISSTMIRSVVAIDPSRVEKFVPKIILKSLIQKNK